MEEAIPPTAKSSPSTAKNVMLGGLLEGLSGLRRAGGALPNERTPLSPPTMWSSTWASSRLAVIPEADLGEFNGKKQKKLFGRKGRNERT